MRCTAKWFRDQVPPSAAEHQRLFCPSNVSLCSWRALGLVWALGRMHVAQVAPVLVAEIRVSFAQIRAKRDNALLLLCRELEIPGRLRATCLVVQITESVLLRRIGQEHGHLRSATANSTRFEGCARD